MTNTLDLVCRLDALDGAQTLRYQELRMAMKSVEEIRELPDSCARRFPSDPVLFLRVAEWITLERVCCPFLDFGLDWSEPGDVWLRLTGGSHVKRFLNRQQSQQASGDSR